jgi:hypothetical protein
MKSTLGLRTMQPLNIDYWYRVGRTGAEECDERNATVRLTGLGSSSTRLYSGFVRGQVPGRRSPLVLFG